MDFIDTKIKETEAWLNANEKQGTLPLMSLEDELLQQEVRHKKEILELCNQFRHHPQSGNEDFKELYLLAIKNGALNHD
jgi:hypothetical protein